MAGTGLTAGDAIRIFNASLFINDDRALPQPYLVESRPELNTESWRVFPDGRMETTYRLRPNLTWHDGTPLTPEDLVLSMRVMKTPELGVSNLLPTRVIDEVVPLDERTFVVRWNRPFPRADALTGRDWAPLPRHLLEAAFEQQSAEQFALHPYWSREYVGLGPFRLDRWEPGAFVEGSAFEGHALGRPGLDRVRVLFVRDPNTAVANMLAGEAHHAFDYTLGFEHGALLKRSWAAQQSGTVLLSPERLRYVVAQFKTEYTSPTEILDPRVRRALAHGIDKQPLVDALLGGEGTAAQTMVPPTLDFYGQVDRVITKYPYDPARMVQLMAEAGLPRGGDGFFANAAGERFSPELRSTAGGQEEQETAIMADGWRRAGVDVRTRLLSSIEDADRQVRSTFPGFSASSTGLEDEPLLNKLYGPNSATAANRWAGSNRGSWTNADYDRFYDTMTTSLDRNERAQAVVQAMKLVSEEVPLYPLYYNYVVHAHAAALQGPSAFAPGGEGTWNIHTWTLR
jgi:peptide/nickel transport system substrate-binding protein